MWPLMTAALAGNAPQRQAALSALVALADGGDRWGAVEGGDGGGIIIGGGGGGGGGDAMMVENTEGSDAVGGVSEGGEGANDGGEEDGEEKFMGEEEMVEVGPSSYTCIRSI